MELIHHAYFKIRTQEIDQNKRLTPPALIMLMQEASMQSAINLKASVWDLEDLNASWVLLRKELSVFKRPGLGEIIKVTTYPAGFDRLFAYRDFKVYNSQDELLATACSTWALMDLDSRKMIRIPVERFEFNSAPDEILLVRPKSKIPILTGSTFQKDYLVNWYDLDWNGHVNNQFIARCLLETIPDIYIQNKILKNFSIHFKAESFWKDRLTIFFQKLGNNYSVGKIIRDFDGKEIAHSYSEWV